MTGASPQTVPAFGGQPPPLAVAAAPNLWQIPLPLPMPGFDAFLSAWLFTAPAPVLVDPGPSSTVPRLLAALDALGVERLEAVLLTHIHLDHAGGVGEVAAAFPQAPVVCHESAVKHLADPSRLWAGSLKTLGDTARAYGPMTPVPPERLADAGAFAFPDLAVIPTPGHAVHHVSFRLGSVLLAGEASGVYLPLGGGEFYLRPATPPRFFLETSLASLEALKAHGNLLTCFGHHGWASPGRPVLDAHGDQLGRWARILEGRMPQSGEGDFEEACLNALLAQDPLLGTFDRLPPEIRQRERYFLKNSIRGFAGYLKSRAETS